MPDRKDWRELLARATVQIIEIVEPVEKNCLQDGYQQREVEGLPPLFQGKQKNDRLSIEQIKAIENLPLRYRAAYFMSRLSLTGRTGYRMMALDACLSLLECSYTQVVGDDIPPYLMEFPCQLLFIIVARIHDAQQGIRARALDCLSSLMQTTLKGFSLELFKSKTQSGLLQRLLLGSLYAPFISTSNSTSIVDTPFRNEHREDLQNNNHGDDDNPCIDLTQIIYDRVSDSKQIVRKSALTLMTAMASAVCQFYSLVRIPESKLDQVLIQFGIADSRVLRSLCLDASLQVKAKALSTVHGLLGT